MRCVRHIVGFKTHWVIANHSPVAPLIVRNADRPDDRFTIKPSQGDTIAPFDIGEILGLYGHVLTVMGVGPGASNCSAPCAGDIRVAWGLDPTTISFKVMITAVRPITEGTGDPLPSRADIANELGLTLPQLYDHLTYLCRLLSLTRPAEVMSGPWRLAALATYARENPYMPPPGDNAEPEPSDHVPSEVASAGRPSLPCDMSAVLSRRLAGDARPRPKPSSGRCQTTPHSQPLATPATATPSPALPGHRAAGRSSTASTVSPEVRSRSSACQSSHTQNT